MFHSLIRAVSLTLMLTVTPLALADDFQARLGRVPVDSRNQATVAGLGHAAAKLDGNRLEIKGEFDGLLGEATIANLHMGAATGARGPVIHSLKISRAAAGELTGLLELDAEQLAALEAGRLYIQIHSESAPDGNLWGWLFRE